ncbi:MAG: transposase [Candidatus Omnitrophica bacterium]|nr:transposase [Candidatus Omnitrophota bacterium]
MARPYRLQGEDILYHITSRGDDRKRIYISDYDYKKFLEYVSAAKDRYKFYLYAYVLMSNHYHLFIETTQPNLSRIMQYINTAYTTYYNIKRKRKGHLFQGRYKSIIVDKDSYFLELTRYIHLNPVKAKMVKSPQGYKWTSFHGYMKKEGDGYIDKDRINIYLDMKSGRYNEFVLEGIGKDTDPLKNVHAGFLLGSSKFIKDKLKNMKKQAEGVEISYRKDLKGQVERKDIVDAVIRYYKKTFEEICNDKQRPMKEKKIAIYLIKKFTGATNSAIGKIFGITYSAISKAERGIVDLIKQNKDIKKEIEYIVSTFKV